MRGRKEKIVKSYTEWRQRNQVRKLRVVMTVVAVFLCVSVAAGVLMTWIEVRNARARLQTSVSRLPQSSALVSGSGAGLPVYDNSFSLRLVNSSHPLPSGFSPDLAACGGIQVEKKILPALSQMMGAVRSAGYPVRLAGGYVSAAEQDKLYQAEVKKLMTGGKLSKVLAESKAQSTVGRGGYCENQTGLAVLFSAENSKSGEEFSSTAQYRWLSSHCVQYGFVLRYPEDKTSVTGIAYQPSWFRYVGSENAMKMREFSMCLEEYVAYVGKQPG